MVLEIASEFAAGIIETIAIVGMCLVPVVLVYAGYKLKAIQA
jgi:hypothetical protein